MRHEPPFAEVFHPAVFIREALESRGWDLDDLATHMSLCKPIEQWQINRLAMELYLELGPENSSLRLGDLSVELGEAFGVAPAYFTGLETAWLAAAGEKRP